VGSATAARAGPRARDSPDARAPADAVTLNHRRGILNDPLGSASAVLDRDGHSELQSVYAPFGAMQQDVGTGESIEDLRAAVPECLPRYNQDQPHHALGWRTPA
jgi:hypothetical protein